MDTEKELDRDLENKLFEEGMNQLTLWLHKKGWTVDIGYLNQDEMLPSSKLINISSRQGIEKQLYSFLHECGHLLIQANWENYEKAYPATARMYAYATTHKQLARSPKYKVDCLSEEIEAWKRGKKLADRLGLYYHEGRYNDLMAKCVYTYVQWANK
jgi:hypothetical protein|tara:strand:+ start:946 stop:1416 length:471 start_codon:yes stop_codon:yes gene_type:complete